MITGSCLCGSVRYEAAQAAGPMAHCHCGQCRKVHGAAFATILPVLRDGFRFLSGEDRLQDHESSPGKRRWFCRDCGSSVISTRDGDDHSLLLRAGTIDAGAPSRAVAHGWVAHKAPWFPIPDDGLARFDDGFPGAPHGAEDDGG